MTALIIQPNFKKKVNISFGLPNAQMIRLINNTLYIKVNKTGVFLQSKYNIQLNSIIIVWEIGKKMISQRIVFA